MLVAVDATPLVGRRTGVGRYVAELVPRLAAQPNLDLLLVPITVRGRLQVAAPAGVRVGSRPAPARLLRRAWLRGDFPPAEALTGRCDVFHGTNFVLPPRRKAAGVVTVHDLTYLRYPDTVTPDVRQFVVLVARAVASGAVVVCPSHAVAEEVREAYGLGVERVRATPLGVDDAWFDLVPPDAALRSRLGVPERYGLFVGTREPRKNLSTLLTSHAAASAADPSTLPLVLVGPAGWGPELTRRAAVHVLDHVDDADLRRLLRGAAALFMPSRYEGFGLPVLEALAAGVPVVASDVPAHREVGGEAVTYVPPGDVDGWAQALLDMGDALPHDPAVGVARARRFTWAACAEATAQAYRVAVGASSTAA